MKRFPRKPCHYGRFSLADARLLVGCIDALVDLDEMRRKPETAMQVRFVAVCRGRLAASTSHEIAYLRWKQFKPDIRGLLMKAEKAAKQMAPPRQESHSLSQLASAGFKHRSGSASQSEQDSIQEVVHREKERQARVEERRAKEQPKKDAFQPRFIEEAWGTRSDWQKDRARNRYNGR